MLIGFKKDSDALESQIIDLCYHMRGGLDYDDAWGIPFSTRENMVKRVNKILKESDPNAKEYM